MHVDPGLDYGRFRALTPELPADVRIMVYPAWKAGRAFEAERIMAHWGIRREVIGRTVQSLSATLVD